MEETAPETQMEQPMTVFPPPVSPHHQQKTPKGKYPSVTSIKKVLVSMVLLVEIVGSSTQKYAESWQTMDTGEDSGANWAKNAQCSTLLCAGTHKEIVSLLTWLASPNYSDGSLSVM